MAAAADESIISFAGAVTQELGRVREHEGGLTVETEAGTFSARRAASCLLAPATGDQVLLARPERGVCFVLAVLVRAEPERAAVVEVDAPAMHLRAPRVEVLAKEGMRLISQEKIALVAQRFALDAREGRVSIQRLALEGREVLARADVLDGVFGAIETAAERLTQRLGRSYRFVEDTDSTHAHDVEVRAAQSFVTRAKDAVHHARRLFKADGEQVHIG
ncbi:MAG: DUF3540 domain-containing protein [Myxococcota bacterium]|nr:DUF3540 domain-containing protein [Myxococcota bacterium]